MKRLLSLLLAAALALSLLSGCSSSSSTADGTVTVAASCYPIYLLASAVAEGSDHITVVPVVNQSVACLHDYSLSVADMKTLEGADLVLLSGAGLEDFMDDALANKPTWDCSEGITLLPGEDGDPDPHIWMDPTRAAQLTANIAEGLASVDPDNSDLYETNAASQEKALTDFAEEAKQALSSLSCRDLITFHEGFAYFADAFDLNILAAVEEEAGSEASAQRIVEITGLVEEYRVPAIFVEKNGSDATAKCIQRECGVEIDALSMLMSGSEYDPETNTYITLMQQNIDTVKEALQ